MIKEILCLHKVLAYNTSAYKKVSLYLENLKQKYVPWFSTCRHMPILHLSHSKNCPGLTISWPALVVWTQQPSPTRWTTPRLSYGTLKRGFKPRCGVLDCLRSSVQQTSTSPCLSYHTLLRLSIWSSPKAKLQKPVIPWKPSLLKHQLPTLTATGYQSLAGQRSPWTSIDFQTNFEVFSIKLQRCFKTVFEASFSIHYFQHM